MERIGGAEAFDSLLDRLREYLGEAAQALAWSAADLHSPVEIAQAGQDLVEIVRSRVRWEIGRLAPTLDPDPMAYLAPEDGSRASVPLRREVAVLFVDLHGFSELCERIPVEALAPLLNLYLELARVCIRTGEDVVDRWMGDAMLGWFNAPPQAPGPSVSGPVGGVAHALGSAPSARCAPAGASPSLLHRRALRRGGPRADWDP